MKNFLLLSILFVLLLLSSCSKDYHEVTSLSSNHTELRNADVQTIHTSSSFISMMDFKLQK